jgi:LemA protein
MEQEQAVFGDLAAARANYSGANTTNAKAEAASQLEGALSRLLVVMENYPELRSSEAVQTLMVQLEGTENRISVERNRYNDSVKSYNVMTKRFPLNLVANLFNYQEKAYFQVSEPEAAKAPAVNLDLSE